MEAACAAIKRAGGRLGVRKTPAGVRGFPLESMALERPLRRFVHPHFCVCVKPLRSFFQHKRKNIANLFTLCAIGRNIKKYFYKF
jgi:hypothetical protein